MTTLICPVRPGEKNDELRYALRSWETNLILPNLFLMTVGHCPAWLQPDAHIEGNRYDAAPFAVYDNVLVASQTAAQQGQDEVVFMNDDFFCMDPTDSLLPVRRNMTLAEHRRRAGANQSHWWAKSLALTADWLASEGFPHPYSFEVHRPLLAAPDVMFSVLASWWDQEYSPDLSVPPQWRTLYGTLSQVEAYPVEDAKMGTDNRVGIGSPWLSTSDNSWLRYGSSFRKRFQKPSRWER